MTYASFYDMFTYPMSFTSSHAHPHDYQAHMHNSKLWVRKKTTTLGLATNCKTTSGLLRVHINDFIIAWQYDLIKNQECFSFWFEKENASVFRLSRHVEKKDFKISTWKAASKQVIYFMTGSASLSVGRSVCHNFLKEQSFIFMLLSEHLFFSFFLNA